MSIKLTDFVCEVCEECTACRKKFIPNAKTLKCPYCASFYCVYCVAYTMCPSKRCRCNQVTLPLKFHDLLEEKDKLWLSVNLQPERMFQDKDLWVLRLISLSNLFNKDASDQSLRDEMQLQENKFTELLMEKTRCMECLSKDNNELKNEITQLRKEIRGIKSLFVNIQDKEHSLNDSVMERVNEEHEKNLRLQFGFDEFEELDELIKIIQDDQEKIREDCKKMEKLNSNAFNDFDKKFEEMRGKMDDFVAEVRTNLTSKKNQLIKDMRANIQSLREQQKAAKAYIKDLQAQNVKRSAALQNKLESARLKFVDAVQLKDNLANYYDETASANEISSPRISSDLVRLHSTLKSTSVGYSAEELNNAGSRNTFDLIGLDFTSETVESSELESISEEESNYGETINTSDLISLESMIENNDDTLIEDEDLVTSNEVSNKLQSASDDSSFENISAAH